MKALFFLLILLYCQPLQAQVTISPEFPGRGDTVKVIYRPAKPSGGAPLLSFTYSTFYDLPWKMEMKREGAAWTAALPLARFATFAAFVLQDGDSVIQPAAGRHYEVMVYENRMPVMNAHLYKGYSLSAQMGRVPGLAAAQAAQYGEELRLHPGNYEARLRLLQYRISKAGAREKERLREEAHRIIAARFNEAPTVPGNVNKVTMGYLILGEASRLDSIRTVIRERYPASALGRELWTEHLAKGKDTARQIQLFEAALKEETPEQAAAFAGMHNKLFIYYAAAKNASRAVYHARRVASNDSSPYRPQTLKRIAETLLEHRLAPDTARAYAMEALAMAGQFPAGVIRHFPETGYIFPYVNDSTRNAVTRAATGSMHAILARIALLQGRRAEAAQQVQEALQASVDRETLDQLDVYYKATADSAGLQHLQELRRKEMQRKVAAMLISRPAPSLAAFTDLQGKPVDTAQLKNKVVLIDFWATWCMPCMEEMPYLQKVYNRYRNHPGVVFMVVNSGARNTLADAQRWSGNRKYTFPVYYNTDPAISDRFRFNTIPATYLIDRDGNIRFSNEGFEGPEVEMKLQLQIETLLQQ